MKMKIGAPVLSVLTLACAAATARAEDAAGRFDILPQALDSAPRQLLQGSDEVTPGGDGQRLRLAQTRSAPVSGTAATTSGAVEEVGLEEVVVTAERRSADAQRTAASVTVRTGQELAAEGRNTLNQILADVPGISGQTFGGVASGVGGSDSPEFGVAIRSIKSNAAGSYLQGSSATAAYTDGVYGGVGGTYDIERVEVLRGPQGTLYGRSATGGVIAIKTKDPVAGKFEGYVQTEAGNFQLQHLTGALNVPLIGEQLTIRLSGDHYEHDGYDDAKGRAVASDNARIKALYTPTEHLSVLLGAATQWNSFNDGGVTYRRTGIDTYYADRTTPIGRSVNSFRQYWAELKWDLGYATLTYLPAYRTWQTLGRRYGVGPGVGGFYVTVNIDEPYDRYLTHEIHLASSSGGRLTWQVGATSFGNKIRDYRQETRWTQNNAAYIARTEDRTINEVGVFGEATYAIFDSTRVTAGLRYDDTDIKARIGMLANNNRLVGQGSAATTGLPEQIVSFNIAGEDGHRTFKSTTWRLRLEHDLTPSNLLYAMVATGFIPGDVSGDTSTPPRANYYNAETLTSYEAGTKNRFLADRLQVNAAAFFYDYGGFQSSITPNTLDPSTTYFTTTPAEMKGGELEMLFQVTPADRIGLDVAYIDSRWVDTTADFRRIVAKEEIAGVPPLTLDLSYHRDFHLANGSSINFHGDVHYFTAYDATTVSAANLAAGFGPYLQIDAQAIANLSLGWSSPSNRYGVGAYVRNANDNRYTRYDGLQSVNPVLGTFTLYDPRTWGITARAQF